MNRLKEIEERAEKATPGPWSVSHKQRAVGYWEYRVLEPVNNDLLADIPGALWNTPQVDGIYDYKSPIERQAQNDCAFIAAARADIPWLLEKVKELTKIINDLNQE